MNITGVTTNFFPTPSETFEDNLSSSIAALAVTVPVTNATEYTDGDIVVLTVEPGTANEATFRGTKSGNSFIDCKWTEGNLGVGHAAGATIIDYIAATHLGIITKGLLKVLNQDGTLKQQPVRDALGLVDAAAAGWEVAPYTFSVASGYNKGNKEYELTTSSDLTGLLTPGMKMKLTRGTAPPTQCFDAETSSSQYASRATPTGITFTDDFTMEAWIKLESYKASTIVARYDPTNFGWIFQVMATGQIRAYARNSPTADEYLSYQSIPLDKWVHVAATVDASGNACTIYINGVSVPIQTIANGSTGANQVSSTPLSVGAYGAATDTFDGEISDVRVWSTIRTADQIRDNMNQQLVGSETGLVVYFKLNGDFNDSTTNANHLTPSGGAVATTLDNPMKTTEYALVHKVTATTVTVFTGTDHNIPNMTLTAPYYSTQKAPFGFPGDRSKWQVTSITKISISTGIGSINNYFISAGGKLHVPIGNWILSYQGVFAQRSTAAGSRLGYFTIATSTPTAGITGDELTSLSYIAVGTTLVMDNASRQTNINLDSSVVYNTYGALGATATGTETWELRGDIGAYIMTAESAYI